MNNELTDLEYHTEDVEYISDEAFSELFESPDIEDSESHGIYSVESEYEFNKHESSEQVYSELFESFEREFPEMQPEDIEAIIEFAWGPIIGAVASAVPSIVKGVSKLIKKPKRPAPQRPAGQKSNFKPPTAVPNRPLPPKCQCGTNTPEKGNPLNSFLNLLKSPQVMNGLLQLVRSKGSEAIQENYEDDYDDDYTDNY